MNFSLGTASVYKGWYSQKKSQKIIKTKKKFYEKQCAPDIKFDNKMQAKIKNFVYIKAF